MCALFVCTFLPRTTPPDVLNTSDVSLAGSQERRTAAKGTWDNKPRANNDTRNYQLVWPSSRKLESSLPSFLQRCAIVPTTNETPTVLALHCLPSYNLVVNQIVLRGPPRSQGVQVETEHHRSDAGQEKTLACELVQL